MNEMDNFPKGLNSGYYLNPADGAPPITCPPNSSPGTNYSKDGMQQPLPICSPGLEYLLMLDQLLVIRNTEHEDFLYDKRYDIKNSMGQKLYYAKDDSSWCKRQCMKEGRPFNYRIELNSGHEILHLGPYDRCDFICCPCCEPGTEVKTPNGNVLGKIVEQCSFSSLKFCIKNAAGEKEFSIRGPSCQLNCCSSSNYKFKILARDGETEIGCIQKKSSGRFEDHFGVIFPMDLDVNMKAVLLGACIEIGYMVFDQGCS